MNPKCCVCARVLDAQGRPFCTEWVDGHYACPPCHARLAVLWGPIGEPHPQASAVIARAKDEMGQALLESVERGRKAKRPTAWARILEGMLP